MKTIDNDIKNQELKRAYLLYGTEGYLIRQYRDKLKKAFFPDGDTMNLSVFQGENCNVEEIRDLADTLPFFADWRLIVIEGSGWCKKGGEEFAEYLPDAPESTYFLFVEEEVDKRSKLYKAITKIGNAVEFVPQTDETLSKWVLARLKREGKGITKQAYQLFIEKTGTDMENIDKELEKLICYTLDRDNIEVSDVEAITTEQTQSKVFEMVDAIAAHQQKKALDLYYDLLSLHEAPMRIMYLITRQFNMMLLVKSMINKGVGQKEIAQTIGSPEWAVRKYQSQCRPYSLEQLKQAIKDGTRYEEDVKTGKLDDQLAVELFIVQYSK